MSKLVGTIAGKAATTPARPADNRATMWQSHRKTLKRKFENDNTRGLKQFHLNDGALPELRLSNLRLGHILTKLPPLSGLCLMWQQTRYFSEEQQAETGSAETQFLSLESIETAMPS